MEILILIIKKGKCSCSRGVWLLFSNVFPTVEAAEKRLGSAELKNIFFLNTVTAVLTDVSQRYGKKREEQTANNELTVYKVKKETLASNICS